MLIQLRRRTKINNPEKTVLGYWNRERGASAYDEARLPQDNSFTEDQIEQVVRAANRLGARIPYKNERKIIKPLLQRKDEIESKLRGIPVHLAIIDNYEEIPWENLKSLFDTFEMKYIGLARMTKILHKKRPHLIPILDTNILVNRYLEPLLQQNGIVVREETEKAICYVKELKKDVDRNKDALIKLQHNLASKGYDIYDISIVRLVDILIWSHFFYRGERVQNI